MPEEAMVTQQRNFGIEFEDEVKSFLTDVLHFQDVKGGQGFHIAPPGEKNQTDVCGRYQDALFIFQCKAAGRTVSRNLREEILAMRERCRLAIQSYKNIKEYSSCRFVKFILITKKIVLPEPNISLLERSDPKIYHATEDLLEYYIDLHDKIGSFVVFNFLADFDVRPHQAESLSFKSLKTTLGKYTVYNFYATPKDLLKYSYVARRRHHKEDFYQRMLEKSRIKRIQEFIDCGGVFPTNVIISLRSGDTSYTPITCEKTDTAVEVGTLQIKNSYNACWIIDGQHRLFSFSKSQRNTPIPCLAFENISIEQERGFFLEINREQRPIQPDLIWDLEGLAHPDKEVGIISNIVRTLNKRVILKDKIYIPVEGNRPGKAIYMAAFCNGIVNAKLTSRITPNCLGKENPLFSESPQTMTKRIADVLDRYFSNFNDRSKSEEHKRFIFGNAGIPIMLYLLEPIVAKIRHVPSYADFNHYLLCVADFFDKNYPTADAVQQLRNDTNSEGARRNIAKAIGRAIRAELKFADFWPKLEESDIVRDIVDMERRLGKLISINLAKATSNWERQRIHESIYNKAQRQIAVDGTDFDENFDLSDELQIIIRKDNWDEVFNDLFIGRNGFLNQDELKVAFSYLSRVRNPKSHGKSVTPTNDEISQCYLYLQKLDRITPYLETSTYQ